MAVFSTGGGFAPPGINFVEYLQSSGTQYFNTEFTANSNTRIVMDVEVTKSGTQWLFGARTTPWENTFSVVTLYGTTVRNDHTGTQSPMDVGTVLRRAILDRDGNRLSFGDQSVTNTEAEFTCDYPLFLLAVNDVGVAASGTMLNCKLYSCRIYDNGVLVRDYWPCYDPDGVVCLYDKVNKEYAYNAGTGEFIAGGAAA